MTSSQAAREPQVKGVAFRTIDTCFTELCGSKAAVRARGVLRPELSDAFRYGTLLAASWYPIAWYRELFAAFRVGVGASRELPRRIGRLAAHHDMKGPHKLLLAKIVSPGVLFSLSQRVFNSFYDTGKFETIESRGGFVRARCTGCEGWDENMWSELHGSCESLLEIAGAKHVRVRFISGGENGDDQCELEARWT